VPEREGEAWLDCTAAMCDGSAEQGGRDRSVGLADSFPLVRHERHSLRSRRGRVCGPVAWVKVGRSAAPHCGVALTGADRSALRSDAALVDSPAWADGAMGAIVSMSLRVRGEGDHFVPMFYHCNGKWTAPMRRARLDRQMQLLEYCDEW
jgi:hypothetical protein